MWGKSSWVVIRSLGSLRTLSTTDCSCPRKFEPILARFGRIVLDETPRSNEASDQFVQRVGVLFDHFIPRHEYTTRVVGP